MDPGIIVKKKKVFPRGLPRPLVACPGKAQISLVENNLESARLLFLAEEVNGAIL